MLKKSEHNRTEEISLVTPTPGLQWDIIFGTDQKKVNLYAYSYYTVPVTDI